LPPVVNKIRQYQKEGVLGIEAFGDRTLLADDMGLGKTLQALHWLRRGRPRGLLPAMIVCPSGVKYMWQREALNQCGLTSQVIEGRYKKGRSLETDVDLYILNYDILPSWVEPLLQANIRTCVADECHTLCNPDTARSRAADKLFKAPQVVAALGISGTPINNRPGEFWHILHLLRPDMFDSRLAFGMSYCEPRWEKNSWTYNGSRDELGLHNLLVNNIMIRRLKTDVALELPEKTRTVQVLELSDPAEYERAAKDVILWLKKQNAAKAKRASRSATLARVGYLRRLAAELKTPAALDWVADTVDQVGKMILFTCHDKMLQAVLDRWPDTPFIDGGVKAIDRQHRIDKFQSTNQPLIVGQVVAMGAGCTLTAASHTAMMEMDYRPAIMCQAEDRDHRIGQHVPTFDHYLVGRGTVEEKMCRLLQDKQDIISTIMDGRSDIYNLNIFDLLVEELQSGK
jgi:SWI/SNF-related matrix-associated actin-dependent regulator 1 of chromatin subfamily A